MHDSAWAGEYYFMDHPVHSLAPKQRAELPQGAHRVRVPELPSARQPDGVRESRDPALVSERQPQRSPEHGRGRPRSVSDRRQEGSVPEPALGGQQQLVGVARAIIANPQVLLADEPTGNLHSAQGKEIMELFRRLNEAGTTIVQATHSDVNASYGMRIINLRDGWVVDG